jgi:murein L,D-transpeptidase YcbB/YkuD
MGTTNYLRWGSGLCLLLGLLVGQVHASSAPLVSALRGQFTHPDVVFFELTQDWTRLERLYALRDYSPIWTDSNGPNRRAGILRQFLYVADEEGLEPATFQLSALATIWHRRSPADLATLDILLSDAFFRYASQIQRGRLSPLEVDPQWHIASPDLHLLELLQNMLKRPDFEAAMRGLAPQQRGYQVLRTALARYRAIASQGDWPTLAAGPSLREGMRSRQVVSLRKRLMAEGLMQASDKPDADVYDPAVKYAVDRFQVLHGQKMDGVVGPATRKAMNVSVADRITQIKLNMERWRWLPRDLGRRYLIVNTAGYELTAFDQGQARFSMWVVIGKQDRQTPEIDGALHTVVFNPYWTVPTTIAIEDLIPLQLRNPRYLQNKKIRVFTNLARQIEVNPRQVDWAQFSKDNFPYVLRQDPGPFNPLGRLKFLFSNEFDVYLHDTPARRLFEQKQRAFSSGCIRVEAPLQLAAFLLANNPSWDLARIQAAVDSGRTHEVKLRKSVPIYLLYLTAWAGADGSVHFYPDVYARDPVIAECVVPVHTGRGRPPQCWL